MEPEEKPLKATRNRKPTVLGRSRTWREIPPLTQIADVVTTSMMPQLAIRRACRAPNVRGRVVGAKRHCFRSIDHGGTQATAKSRFEALSPS